MNKCRCYREALGKWGAGPDTSGPLFDTRILSSQLKLIAPLLLTEMWALLATFVPHGSAPVLQVGKLRQVELTHSKWGRWCWVLKAMLLQAESTETPCQ